MLNYNTRLKLTEIFCARMRNEYKKNPLKNGVDHFDQVMKFANDAILYEKIDKDTALVIAIACAVHDIGRSHMELSNNHQEAGSIYILNTLYNDIENIVGRNNAILIASVVGTHSDKTKNSTESIVEAVLKDADALSKLPITIYLERILLDEKENYNVLNWTIMDFLYWYDSKVTQYKSFKYMKPFTKYGDYFMKQVYIPNINYFDDDTVRNYYLTKLLD